jgi:MFS family permease
MVPRRYRDLLGIPGMPGVVAAAFVGGLPYGMLGLALLLLARQATGSFAAAGLVAAAHTLAAGAGAPVLGRLVDRLGRPRVVAGCGVGQAAALAAVIAVALAGAGTAALAVMAALAGLAMPPLSPSMRSLWSELAPRERIDTAFALEAVFIELFFIGGPLLTGAIVLAYSPAAAVGASAAFVLTGSLAFATTEPVRRRSRQTTANGRIPAALSSTGMRTVVAAMILAAVVFGVLEVAIPAFARHEGAAAAAGLLLSAMAVGSLAGGLAYGSREPRSAPDRRFLVLLALFAAGLAPLTLAWSIPVMAVLMVLAGLALAPLTAAGYSLVGRLAPTGALTEAFAWQAVANVTGAAAGAALAGAVVEGPGIRPALALASAAAAVAFAVALAARSTLRPQVAS